jgi:hypothetical protein
LPGWIERDGRSNGGAAWYATRTGKGPPTLPKETRGRLNREAGAVLGFRIQAGNTGAARQVRPDARRIRGLLEFPHVAPLTFEAMNEAVSKRLRGQHARSGGPPVSWPMIGFDNDILQRPGDHHEPAQNKRIDTLGAAHGGKPGSSLVTDVVLAEAVWTLKAAFEQEEHAELVAVYSLLE